MHKGAFHRFAPALLAITAIACASQTNPPVDSFGACNMSGASERANNYSMHETHSINSLATIAFKGLHGSMLAPPLPIRDGRSMLVSTGGLVSMVIGDSIVWSNALGSIVPGLAVDSSGMIYAVALGSRAKGTSVYGITADGKRAWTAQLPPYATGSDTSGFLALSLPLAIGDGVIVGSNAGRIDRIDGKGKHVWSVQRGASVARSIAASPSIGIVAALTHNDYDLSDSIIAIDPITGVERWSVATAGARIVEGPAIVGDLVIA